MNTTPSYTPDISTPARNAAVIIAPPRFSDLGPMDDCDTRRIRDVIAAQYRPLLEQARDALIWGEDMANLAGQHHSRALDALDQIGPALAALTRALDEGKGGREGTMSAEAQSPAINSENVLRLILGLVRFPYAQICRHHVALDLLSLLEESGFDIPPELVKAVSNGSNGDEEAERILLRLSSDRRNAVSH